MSNNVEKGTPKYYLSTVLEEKDFVFNYKQWLQIEKLMEGYAKYLAASKPEKKMGKSKSKVDLKSWAERCRDLVISNPPELNRIRQTQEYIRTLENQRDGTLYPTLHSAVKEKMVNPIQKESKEDEYRYPEIKDDKGTRKFIVKKDLSLVFENITGVDVPVQVTGELFEEVIKYVKLFDNYKE